VSAKGQRVASVERKTRETDVRVEIDRKTGEYKTFRRWKVFADDSTELEFPERELRLDDAVEGAPGAESVGDKRRLVEPEQRRISHRLHCVHIVVPHRENVGGILGPDRIDDDPAYRPPRVRQGRHATHENPRSQSIASIAATVRTSRIRLVAARTSTTLSSAM